MIVACGTSIPISITLVASSTPISPARKLSMIAAFSFGFNGHTYTLTDAASSMAWFLDPDAGFVGVQYVGSYGANSIEFASGGAVAGDMGLFTSTGGSAVGPITLGTGNFTLQQSGNIPEPGTLGCFMLGLGAAALAGRRRRSLAGV